MKKKQLFFFAIIGFAIAVACNKKETVDKGTTKGTLPINPYDTIHPTYRPPVDVKLDTSTIAGLHAYIFSKKCAMPACHDGAFEPDFRTVESSYNTLVYHKPVKYDWAGKRYSYRVYPLLPDSSWLHVRVTTDDKVLGRMPLYANALTQKEVDAIDRWIKNGARDFLGNSPAIPNYEPTIYGVYAELPDAKNYRVDTIRGKVPIYPFYIPKNTNVTMYFCIYDDKTLPYFLTYNKIKFSTSPTDFSNAITKDLTFLTTPVTLPVYNNVKVPFYFSIKINTNLFKPGDLVYMRYYVKDADHSSPSELPANAYLMQSYFSFQVGN
ncbi:MAG: hypothetical protein NTX03_07075 [Bacteroidetes bacterium]|nr:hypothetical protein [Bacteroidota bacterium]